MSVRGIVEAYKQDVESWGFSDIIIDDETRLGLKGSPTQVAKAFTKGAKSAGEIYEVSAQEAVDIIIKKLTEKHII